jgi:hypothetical protein
VPANRRSVLLAVALGGLVGTLLRVRALLTGGHAVAATGALGGALGGAG